MKMVMIFITISPFLFMNMTSYILCYKFIDNATHKRAIYDKHLEISDFFLEIDSRVDLILLFIQKYLSYFVST